MLTASSVGHRYAIGQYVDQAGDVISHVNISNVRVQDGGLYTCKATNSLGSAIHAARLNIYGKSKFPQDLIKYRNVKVLVGGEWSHSRSGCFTPVERAPVAQSHMGLGRTLSRSGRFKEERNLFPLVGLSADSSVVQLLALSLY